MTCSNLTRTSDGNNDNVQISHDLTHYVFVLAILIAAGCTVTTAALVPRHPNSCLPRREQHLPKVHLAKFKSFLRTQTWAYKHQLLHIKVSVVLL